jgi:hypothetical protein
VYQSDAELDAFDVLSEGVNRSGGVAASTATIAARSDREAAHERA